ncbi:MAG: hypothetical protein HY862_18880 [Chloroflexi bacterium]|nr:hypothetical protein [Chloroflexota bacterium]
MSSPHISRQEWRRVSLYAVVLISLTVLPYLIAWVGQGSDWRFSGSLFGAEDGNAYLGKMRLGARGIWDFYLFYSPEKHDSVSLLYLPYIIPGQVVGLFMSEDNPAMVGALIAVFHTLRVIFNFVLILTTYRFIAIFLRAPSTRFLALIFATIGGGLGWLVVLTGHLPPEFYIPEGFSWLVLLGLPHIALARVALLGGFIALFKSLSLQKWQAWSKWALLAGLCWLVVGLSVTFYFVLIDALLGAWGLVVWARTRRFPFQLALRCAVAVGVALPFLAYFLISFNNNPAFAQWSKQNLLASPNPLQYVFAYLILGVLAWIGGRWAWQRSHSNELRPLLLISWVLIVPILVYLPINVQRRLAEGVLIPLAILAAAGLKLWTGLHLPKWHRARLAVVVVTSLSSLFFLIGVFFSAFNHDTPVFEPVSQLAAFQWLDKQAPNETVVLGAMETGNALPVYTNLRPFLGHGPETIYSKRREREVSQFFRDEMTPDQRKALYRSVGIRYIFYSPAERELAHAENDTSPSWAADGRLIYDEAGYQIYEVLP